MFQAIRKFLRSGPVDDTTTRFIVVSLPRTGTHMLRTLLNQHPNIRTETELFNETAKNCRKWRRKSAKWVLDNIAWREGPQQIRGCMTHLCHGNAWGLWQHLMTRTDVRYLCLRRFNLLEQYLSFQQALIHQRWQTYRDQSLPPVQAMSFQPHEVEEYFEETESHWQFFESAFSSQPHCTVWYEDLCRDIDSVSRQAQKFLGAAQITGLEPDTVKVGRPARELISNYDELREYFSGTPYSAFFADEVKLPRRLAA